MPVGFGASFVVKGGCLPQYSCMSHSPRVLFRRICECFHQGANTYFPKFHQDPYSSVRAKGAGLEISERFIRGRIIFIRAKGLEKGT